MTPDPPPRTVRRPRPGADARRQALGLEGHERAGVDHEIRDDDTQAVGSPGRAEDPRDARPRDSLRAALARIPDLDGDVDEVMASARAKSGRIAPVQPLAPLPPAQQIDPADLVTPSAPPGSRRATRPDRVRHLAREAGPTPGPTPGPAPGPIPGPNPPTPGPQPSPPEPMPDPAPMPDPIPDPMPTARRGRGDGGSDDAALVIIGDPAHGDAWPDESGPDIGDDELWTPREDPEPAEVDDLWTPAAAPAEPPDLDDLWTPRHDDAGAEGARDRHAPVDADEGDDVPWLDPASEVEPELEPVGPVARTGGRRTRISPPPRPPWWRRAGFALALVALVVAIPVLGRAGYRLVRDSTDGDLTDSSRSPEDPGYEELVTSTPTSLVVQKTPEGALSSLTFLSLPRGANGGSVVFVPIDTAIPEPGFGVDRLRSSYDLSESPANASGQVAGQTAEVLNAGIDELIELDDRGWAQTVGPVAPIEIDNPDPIDLGGTTLPAGTVSLTAEQVGPYLSHRVEGESDLNRLYRQEAFWKGWMGAIATSGRLDAVPGEAETGMGLFARSLAGGTSTYDTLPGVMADDGSGRFLPDDGEVATLVAAAVPVPDAASEGSRRSVRLLNGVAPERVSIELIRQITLADGTVTIVGNGPSFDRVETDIIYATEEMALHAEAMRAALGIQPEPRLDPSADSADITIVLGEDLLGEDGTGSVDEGSQMDPDVSSITVDDTTAAPTDAAPTDATPTDPGGP